jgi:hypothetical protein
VGRVELGDPGDVARGEPNNPLADDFDVLL